jgi:hypothetical protein
MKATGTLEPLRTEFINRQFGILRATQERQEQSRMQFGSTGVHTMLGAQPYGRPKTVSCALSSLRAPVATAIEHVMETLGAMDIGPGRLSGSIVLGLTNLLCGCQRERGLAMDLADVGDSPAAIVSKIDILVCGFLSCDDHPPIDLML